MQFNTPRPSGFSVGNEVISFPPAALKSSIGKLVAADGLGGYEPETLSAAAALIEIESIGHFADIGANIGVSSVVLKSIFGDRLTVDAYEPLPSLSGHIEAIAALNRLQIRVDNRAISNKQGQATFYVSARSDSSNSLNPRFRTAASTLEVALTTLDELYLNRQPAPGLLKIDTESTEPDVLEGGLRYLGAHRPWIICEVLKGRSEARLTALFNSVGYVGFHLTGETPTAAEEIAGDGKYAHRDWLFAPRQLPPTFAQRYQEWQQAFSAARVPVASSPVSR